MQSKLKFALVALAFVFSAASAQARSCVPSASNPGGCMGVPTDLNDHDDMGQDVMSRSCIPSADSPGGCMGVPTTQDDYRDEVYGDAN